MSAKEFLKRYADGVRNFDGVSLRGASLREVDLSSVSLRGADLSSADLVQSQLDDADLEGVNLRGANLGSTRFHGANLRQADLRDANAHASYDGADLTGARFTEGGAKKALRGNARLDGAQVMPDEEYRAERLARPVDQDWLAAHLEPDLKRLAAPSDSDDEWDQVLVFPAFQAWLDEFEETSAQLAIRASYGAALTTLPYWDALEASPEAREPVLVCPPRYKLEGIAKYLATPNDETLHRLAQLIDFTSQDPRAYSGEMHPWIHDDDIESKASWAEEAADSCLEVLLYTLMGPYYDSRSNVTAQCLWFAGMSALSAHRDRLDDPIEPALETVVAGIREQLTRDGLGAWLTPRPRLYRAAAPW